jgi:hypothetical protein
MYIPTQFILSSLESKGMTNLYRRLNCQSTTDFINYKDMPVGINLT